MHKKLEPKEYQKSFTRISGGSVEILCSSTQTPTPQTCSFVSVHLCANYIFGVLQKSQNLSLLSEFALDKHTIKRFCMETVLTPDRVLPMREKVFHQKLIFLIFDRYRPKTILVQLLRVPSFPKVLDERGFFKKTQKTTFLLDLDEGYVQR